MDSYVQQSVTQIVTYTVSNCCSSSHILMVQQSLLQFVD